MDTSYNASDIASSYSVVILDDTASTNDIATQYSYS